MGNAADCNIIAIAKTKTLSNLSISEELSTILRLTWCSLTISFQFVDKSPQRDGDRRLMSFNIYTNDTISYFNTQPHST